MGFGFGLFGRLVGAVLERRGRCPQYQEKV